MSNFGTRDTLKTMEEIREVLENWEEVQLCQLGDTHYAIFEKRFIGDIKQIHRWKISNKLFREAKKTYRVIP